MGNPPGLLNHNYGICICSWGCVGSGAPGDSESTTSFPATSVRVAGGVSTRPALLTRVRVYRRPSGVGAHAQGPLPMAWVRFSRLGCGLKGAPASPGPDRRPRCPGWLAAAFPIYVGVCRGTRSTTSRPNSPHPGGVWRRGRGLALRAPGAPRTRGVWPTSWISAVAFNASASTACNADKCQPAAGVPSGS
jgi:hypothetical protein